MCFKFSAGGSYRSADTKANQVENKDTKKVSGKQRLLKTKGEDYGDKLSHYNSANVRKIFGN